MDRQPAPKNGPQHATPMLREAQLETPTLPSRARKRVHVRTLHLQAIGWTLFSVAVAAAMAAGSGHVGFELAFTALAFGAVTLPYFLYGLSSFRRDVTHFLRERPARLFAVAVACPVGIYVTYALGTGCFDWSPLLRLVAFVTVPTALALWAGQDRPQGYRLRWQDALAVFCIWVPFDTGLLSMIWAWPAGEGAYVVNTSLAVSLAVTLFACWRGMPELRFRWAWSWHDVKWATYGVLGFTAFALPIGFATGFITLNPTRDLGKILGAPLGIFFFIAVPEELLFRGLIQNMLRRLLGNQWAALAVASVFFGATHLNNEPLWDWRFFLLATIAGAFYGLVHDKTRSLLAPALTHAAVDVIWLLLLHV